jgi:hypothetical protein
MPRDRNLPVQILASSWLPFQIRASSWLPFQILASSWLAMLKSSADFNPGQPPESQLQSAPTAAAALPQLPTATTSAQHPRIGIRQAAVTGRAGGPPATQTPSTQLQGPVPRPQSFPSTGFAHIPGHIGREEPPRPRIQMLRRMTAVEQRQARLGSQAATAPPLPPSAPRTRPLAMAATTHASPQLLARLPRRRLRGSSAARGATAQMGSPANTDTHLVRSVQINRHTFTIAIRKRWKIRII